MTSAEAAKGSAAVGSDSIFAVIAAFRSAYAAYRASDEDPRLGDDCYAAALGLLAATPNTLAGAVAGLEALGERPTSGSIIEIYGNGGKVEAFLLRLAAVLRRECAEADCGEPPLEGLGEAREMSARLAQRREWFLRHRPRLT